MNVIFARVRRSGPWMWLVGRVAAPLYRLFWEYVLNARGKALYLRSEYRGRTDDTLDSRSTKIVREPEFVAFAERLHSRISNALLERERQKLLAASDESEGFSTDLFPALDNETRVEILKFALSPAVLGPVIGFLRVAPRLKAPNILFNIARPDLAEEGSKQWHRDAWTYRTLTLFMCLRELTDGGGPYYAIGTDEMPFHAAVPKERIDFTQSEWKRYRLSDEDVFRYVDRDKVAKLTGPAGTAIFVDSGACYHKGGRAMTQDRLMLQLRFVTDDGDFDAPRVEDWAEIPAEMAPLLADPLRRFVCDGNETALIRKLGLPRLLKVVYEKVLKYYAHPRKTEGRRAPVTVVPL